MERTIPRSEAKRLAVWNISSRGGQTHRIKSLMLCSPWHHGAAAGHSAGGSYFAKSRSPRWACALSPVPLDDHSCRDTKSVRDVQKQWGLFAYFTKPARDSTQSGPVTDRFTRHVPDGMVTGSGPAPPSPVRRGARAGHGPLATAGGGGRRGVGGRGGG